VVVHPEARHHRLCNAGENQQHERYQEGDTRLQEITGRRGIFRAWQIDVTYSVLSLLDRASMVWELRLPPADVARGPQAGRR